MKLEIHDRSLWEFAQGEWRTREDGALEPVVGADADAESGIQGYRFAFYKARSYRNFTARFDFLQQGHSEIGLIFRARDAAHFHVLHFPCCGQACRAQHFWAAVSVMDDSGYLRIGKREKINRINSITDGNWHRAAVELQGDTLRAEIDGRSLFEYAAAGADGGFVGVMSFNGALLRNVEITGEPDPVSVWAAGRRQATNWFYPLPTEEAGLWQMPINLLKVSDEELLLHYGVKSHGGTERTYYLSRSVDGGTSWLEPELWWRKADSWQGQMRHIHKLPDGSLQCFLFTDGIAAVERMSSRDGGRTWSEPVRAAIPGLPETVDSLHIGPQAFVNLQDGAVLLLTHAKINTKIPGTHLHTWGSHHYQAFVSRSDDGGQSWAEFVNIDGITGPAGERIPGNMDLTEVCGTQCGDGSIIAFIRPVYSPWMWEAHSHDGGWTWDTCVPGPFPGYATPNMLRTFSGYLVVAHRMPGLTLDVSLDDGKSWTHAATIDSAIWAMGSMIEVEPDKVLYVYWDSLEAQMRGQFIEISQQGIRPYARHDGLPGRRR